MGKKKLHYRGSVPHIAPIARSSVNGVPSTFDQRCKSYNRKSNGDGMSNATEHQIRERTLKHTFIQKMF